MADNKQTTRKTTVPWLMFGTDDDNGDCCFYDVAEQQCHHHIDLPAGGDKTCRGSAFGWLFMTQETPDVFLLNPLTGNQIPLPPITTFPEVLAYRPEKRRREYLLRQFHNPGGTVAQDKKYTEKRYIERVAMSADPGSSTDELIVMAMCFNDNSSLVFCNPARDKTWTAIPYEAPPPQVAFADLVFWNGQFYVLDHDGRIFVCDLSQPGQPKLSFFLDLFPLHYLLTESRYLVVSPAGDELMMVTRDVPFSRDCLLQFTGKRCDFVTYNREEEEAPDIDYDTDDAAASKRTYWTNDLRVFKLVDDDEEEEEGKKDWDEVDSIGDFALFLGFNAPVFVSTEEHPGLTPNSIYFTDDLASSQPWWGKGPDGDYDMGIYNLITKTMQPLCSATSVHKNHPLLRRPQPVWISPSQPAA